jgi:hypothetical protein
MLSFGLFHIRICLIDFKIKKNEKLSFLIYVFFKKQIQHHNHEKEFNILCNNLNPIFIQIQIQMNIQLNLINCIERI